MNRDTPLAQRRLKALVSLAVLTVSCFITACGGGGGSAPGVVATAGPTPSPGKPTPTATPTATATPTPTATPSPTPIPVISASQFRYYPLSGANPFAIVAPPDGNLWVTESGLGQVAKISTSGQTVSYELEPGAAVNTVEPLGLVVAPDGSLWIAERNAFAIAHVTTDGVVRAQLPTGGTNGPDTIAYGSDGNLWFTQDVVPSIVGQMTQGGQYTGVIVPQSVYDVTAGSDGNLWLAAGTGVIRLTTAGTSTVYPAPMAGGSTLGQIQSVCTASDGNVWAAGITSTQAYALKITPSGTYSAYAAPGSLPPQNTDVPGMATIGCAGPHVFVAASLQHQQSGPTILTEFTLTGSVVQARQVPPTGSQPMPIVSSMTLGPDGALWFVDSASQTVDAWQFQ